MEGPSGTDDLSAGCSGLDFCRGNRKLLFCSSVRICFSGQARAGLATCYYRVELDFLIDGKLRVNNYLFSSGGTRAVRPAVSPKAQFATCIAESVASGKRGKYA